MAETTKAAPNEKIGGAMMTVAEAAKFLGVSVQTVYNYTHRKLIPHYKPTNGLLYFDVEELKSWQRRNRVATDEEIGRKAAELGKKGGAR